MASRTSSQGWLLEYVDLPVFPKKCAESSAVLIPRGGKTLVVLSFMRSKLVGLSLYASRSD